MARLMRLGLACCLMTTVAACAVVDDPTEGEAIDPGAILVGDLGAADSRNDTLPLAWESTVSGRLTWQNTSDTYAFQGRPGDMARLYLVNRRGAMVGADVTLALYRVARGRSVLVTVANDCPGDTTNGSCIEAPLPESENGQYYAVATTPNRLRRNNDVTYNLSLSCLNTSGVCGVFHCGDRGAGSCPDGTYCDFNVDCGRADGGGTCLNTPEMCITLYDPVCGCDGLTYSNSCVAASQGVDVDFEGPCPDCTAEECGPAPGMPNSLCPDGINWSGPGDCVRDPETLACGWEILSCP